MGDALREPMMGELRMLQVLARQCAPKNAGAIFDITPAMARRVAALDGGHEKSIIAAVPVPIRDTE